MAHRPRTSTADPKKVFDLGLSFTSAAQIIQRTHSKPAVANAAFGMELFLKALALLENGKFPTGHNLKDLFHCLTIDSQRAIQTDAEAKIKKLEAAAVAAGVVALRRLDFNTALERSSEAFTEFRYAFEHDPESLTWTAALISEGVKERIYQMQPHWRPAQSPIVIPRVNIAKPSGIVLPRRVLLGHRKKRRR